MSLLIVTALTGCASLSVNSRLSASHDHHDRSRSRRIA